VREQRHGRFQFHVVWASENLMRGSTGDRQQGVDAFAKPGTQDGVVEVSRRLRRAFDRVMPRGGTESEAVVLREYVPHPVGSLLTRGEFREGPFDNRQERRQSLSQTTPQ
jgi:hypothetical protein